MFQVPLIVMALSAASATTAVSGPKTEADSLTAVRTVEYVGDHSAHAAHGWSFAVVDRGDATVALLELRQNLKDPERDDRVLARVMVPGLEYDEAAQTVVWDDGNGQTVCGVIESSFWTGFGPRFRPTGACELLCEHEAVWEDGAGLEPRTRERVTLAVR